MRRLLTVALALIMLGGGVALTPAQADEPSAPIITWPEITQFNPELVDYEIHIADAGGEGELVAWWGEHFRSRALLPHVGAAVLEFDHEGTIEVVVARCEAGYQILADCAEVARSAPLTVLTRFGLLTVDMATEVGLGVTEVQVNSYPKTAIDRYEWQIVEDAQSGHVLATGTANGPFREGRYGADVFDLQVPPAVQADVYKLRVTGIVSTAEYGELKAVTSTSFRYNPVIPTLKVTQNRATFHPHPDGYQDSVELDVTANQDAALELTVTDSKGTVMHRSDGSAGVGHSGLLFWKGTNLAGKRVAPGTYKLAIRGLSNGGNQGNWQGKVVVSGKRLVTVTKSFTVRAAPSLSSTPYVGKCSKLARRAKGGLGFYSQTKCRSNPKRSAVAAYFGAYLPRAIEGRYDSVQVTLNGGPATRSRTNYINLAYAAPRSQKLVKLRSLRGKGALRGRTASASQIFDRTKERPYLIWWAGLAEGSRFNVNSYKVTTTYQVLR